MDKLEEHETCRICGEEATGVYEGVPVCTRMVCEYRIQVDLDLMEEAGQ